MDELLPPPWSVGDEGEGRAVIGTVFADQSPLPSIKAEGVPDAEVRGRRIPSADVAPDDFALFPAAISINISPANGAGPMAARCHKGHCSAFALIRPKGL